MRKQKYHNGDLVRVADDLGPTMKHFRSGCDAIVVGSYKDEYGRASWDDSREPIYTLWMQGRGTSAWYYEHQLTLK